MDMQILVQIMVGFGAKNIHRYDSIAAAKAEIGKAQFDLMVIGANLSDGDGYELVNWIRREAPEPNRFAPALMVCGHTPVSKVAQARDCGAHFVVAKPLTPVVLLERILWIAREKRPFVEDETYCGPDRRFKYEGPPEGSSGRRRDDLQGELSAVAELNMSQDQIDAMMQPRKVSL